MSRAGRTGGGPFQQRPWPKSDGCARLCAAVHTKRSTGTRRRPPLAFVPGVPEVSHTALLHARPLLPCILVLQRAAGMKWVTPGAHTPAVCSAIEGCMEWHTPRQVQAPAHNQTTAAGVLSAGPPAACKLLSISTQHPSLCVHGSSQLHASQSLHSGLQQLPCMQLQPDCFGREARVHQPSHPTEMKPCCTCGAAWGSDPNAVNR
jgi:hypothetical protein